LRGEAGAEAHPTDWNWAAASTIQADPILLAGKLKGIAMRFGTPIFGLIVLLAGAATPRPAAADWEYTKWGMTPEQVVKASSGAVLERKARSAGADSGLEIRAEGEFVSGPLRFDVSFGFDGNGGLAFVTYSIDRASQNPLLLDWLVKRHGEPQAQQDPEGDVKTLIWNGPGKDSIELNIPAGGPGFVVQHPPEK